MMYGEHRARTEARQIAVSTSIVSHAPADRVWQSVIHLASVPKPESVIFHSVAYPIRTSLAGSGLGARRKCVFSTGSIVEPITIWKPGRELRFSVVSQPPLMRELTPYSDVHPPHLKLEYLRSREGQFTLTRQADGTTLLTGTRSETASFMCSTLRHLTSETVGSCGALGPTNSGRPRPVPT